MNSNVTIVIGKKDCKQCDKLKDHLEKTDDKYIYFDYDELSKEEKMKLYEIRKMYGFDITFPITFISKIFKGFPPVEVNMEE